MEEKKNLKDFSFNELKQFAVAGGEKPYRGKQIAEWLYKRETYSINEMSNQTKKFREWLEKESYIGSLEVCDKQESSDGTIKFLFSLGDGKTIETVFIPSGARGTLCISTQVGCKLSCAFCATGMSGFSRNLTQGEIIEQIIAVKKENAGHAISNLVFMGMGEPFDNFNSLIGALSIISSSSGLGFGARKITVSTSGMVPEIIKFGERFSGINLAVSLHSADDAIRSLLVPLNKKYPVALLAKTLRKYPLHKTRRITLEVTLFDSINDSLGDAEKLAEFVAPLKAKVNIIPFNAVENSGFSPSRQSVIDKFTQLLEEKGVTVTVRKSRGGDISAACGQLYRKKP